MSEALAAGVAVRPTKERVLDAAEALFAAHGYVGVSIRDIHRLADAELGVIHYHFGRKEDLFAAVIARRADEHCRGMLDSLAIVTDAAAPLVPSIEAVLDAFLAPILYRLWQCGDGWRNYVRLVAGATDLYRGEAMRPLLVPYDRVLNAYLEALGRALPSAPSQRLAWSFYFWHSTLAHVLRDVDTVGRFMPNGEEPGPEALRRHIVPHFAAGFYRLVAEP